ncbi:MAG: winged helix-turn-helix transcriptional regulator, partial [Methanomicrobiales archaeon]|nr:winged helix-turn-helix transcriptional regulator [Methanomicrobiales archaeon]
MDEKGVILNKELFEVLSSDIRIDILKSLNTRRKTNSELAKELSLKASTIHHHLERLDDTGL